MPSVSIRYLYHSGFAVKTASHLFIFDYYLDTPRGCGPDQGVVSPSMLQGRDVVVFVSHSHGDHYNPAIFQWRKGNPQIRYILADEPTSALDAENRDHLLTLLQKTYYSAGILFVSHDVFALKMFCKDTAILEQGTIIERQNTEALFTYPQQEWTQAFVRAAETRKGEDWSWKAL